MKTKVDLLRNRKTESIVGIDVGTNSIKAVELSHGGKSTRLVAYADLDNNISANITPQSLCSNILKLLETPILGDFKANKINLSLPRHIGHNHFASLEIENNNDIDKIASLERPAEKALPVKVVYEIGKQQKKYSSKEEYFDKNKNKSKSKIKKNH